MHDWCYTTTSCMFFQYNLPYFVPYKWKCNGGAPYCGKYRSRGRWRFSWSYIVPVGDRAGGDSCSHQLCECDRKFVSCLSRFKCPHSKAMCKSPWRYFQNLFMGLGTGMVNFWMLCLKLIPLFHLINHRPLKYFSQWPNTIIIRILSMGSLTRKSLLLHSSIPSRFSLTNSVLTWSSEKESRTMSTRYNIGISIF